MFKPLFIALIILSESVSAADRPAPAVTTYQVKHQAHAEFYRTSGTLRAEMDTELRTEVAGRITRLAVHSGEQVEQGQLLLEIDHREAQAEVARLQSELQLHRQQLQRQQSLATTSVVAQENLDIKRNDLATTEADITIARLRLEKHRLFAPFSGVLGEIDLVQGGWAPANSLLTTLDQISRLRLEFQLPESRLQAISVGQQLYIESVAWPEESFPARVSRIATRLNEQRATLQITAEVDNPDGRLLPGMRVAVKIPMGDPQARLLVPARSLLYEGEQASVMRLDAQSKVLRTPVTTGLESGEWVEITAGLRAGDQIVDRGLVKAQNQRPVRVVDTGGQN